MTIALFLEDLRRRRPQILYVATWTALVAATVAVVSFSPEFAFAWAVSPQSAFAAAGECADFGLLRLPLDGPGGEVVCLPAKLFERCGIDLFVPPVFAGVVVAASVCFVRSIGLWEADEYDDEDEEMNF